MSEDASSRPDKSPDRRSALRVRNDSQLQSQRNGNFFMAAIVIALLVVIVLYGSYSGN